MSISAERRQAEWRSRTIRQLLELENQAKYLRDELESDPEVRLDLRGHQVADLNSIVTEINMYLERSIGATGL